MSIPKIIHYCWISGDPFPDKVINCIESWKTLMPDYRLELWDKKKCLKLRISFVNDTIKRKNYAFTSDFIRAYSLFTFGGVYLDSDVFLRKSLDPLLTSQYITIIESWKNKIKRKHKYDKKNNLECVDGMAIQAAVMASEPGHPFLKDVIDFYSNKRFNETTEKFFYKFIAPDIQASILTNYGFIYKDELQRLKEGITILPSNVIESNIELHYPDSYGTHMCLGSWLPPKNQFQKIIYIIKRLAYLMLKTLKIIK